MKYEIINYNGLDSFIVPEEDFEVLKEIGDFKYKINDCNGAVRMNIILKYKNYINEMDLFTDRKHYMTFDKWFKENENEKLELIINELKEINSEEELRDALYEHAFITTINVDDIVNDTIDELREIIEEGYFEGIITYNQLFKNGVDWIDNRYGDIHDLLHRYFNQ